MIPFRSVFVTIFVVAAIKNKTLKILHKDSHKNLWRWVAEGYICPKKKKIHFFVFPKIEFFSYVVHLIVKLSITQGNP